VLFALFAKSTVSFRVLSRFSRTGCERDAAVLFNTPPPKERDMETRIFTVDFRHRLTRICTAYLRKNNQHSSLIDAFNNGRYLR